MSRPRTLAMDAYMETLPGCAGGAGGAAPEGRHRFLYGQLVCFQCGKPIEAALAERLAHVEHALGLARDGLRLVEDGPADPSLAADAQWCAGVAMSARSAIEEWMT